jgi:hypothetical protein
MRIPLKCSLATVVLIAGSAMAVVAFAQPPGVPNPYTIPSPTGNELVRAENGGPFIDTVALVQLRDAAGYTILAGATAPLTGQTFQSPNNISAISLQAAGSLSSFTVVTPTSPVDGQRLQIFSNLGITTFALTAPVGFTVTTSTTTMAAGGSVEFIFQASTKTWFRIQ